MTDSRLFLIWPDGRIEELDDGDGTWDYDPDPELYEDLIKAGYPPSYHGDFSNYDAIIDLRVVGDQVTVFTPGPGPKQREHEMGSAAGVFLAWMREHFPNNDQ